MEDTDRQLGEIADAQRKFDDLKRIHQCFGKFCAICSTCYNPGGIITNIRPTKSLRLILGLIYEINLAEIKLKD